LGGCVDRVLAEDVLAERDHPPFDRVTMDGIAIRHADWAAGTRTFTVRGAQPAGAPPGALAEPGDCIDVMTGAVLPTGADAVIPVERLERRGNQVTVAADYRVDAHQFVHRRGSDRPAGSVLL